MIRIIWNKRTESYTVSNSQIVVRGIPCLSQAVAVRMAIRLGDSDMPFGVVERRAA